MVDRDGAGPKLGTGVGRHRRRCRRGPQHGVEVVPATDAVRGQRAAGHERAVLLPQAQVLIGAIAVADALLDGVEGHRQIVDLDVDVLAVGVGLDADIGADMPRPWVPTTTTCSGPPVALEVVRLGDGPEGVRAAVRRRRALPLVSYRGRRGVAELDDEVAAGVERELDFLAVGRPDGGRQTSDGVGAAAPPPVQLILPPEISTVDSSS